MRALLLLLLLSSCGRSLPKAGRSPRIAGSDAGTVANKDAGLFDSGCSLAQVSFFNNAEDWLDAIGNQMLSREDFDQEPLGPIAFPYFTDQGVTLDGTPPATAQIISPGSLSKLVHARDFSTTITVELPGEATAIAFDFFTAEEGWNLVVDEGRMILLAEGSISFAGIVFDCGRSSTFGLRGP